MTDEITLAKQNGKPEFNFRKMSYAHEEKMQRLRIDIERLDKKLNGLSLDDDINPLLDEISAKNHEILQMMTSIITYLPDDYLVEGVTSADINYADVENVLANVCFGAFDRLAVDIAQARQNYVKKSMATSKLTA